MNGKQIRALGFAGALVGWSFTAGLDRPWRRHPIAQAAIGTALAAVNRAPLGLRPPAIGSGFRLGAVVASLVGAGVALTTALPPVRSEMLLRELPEHSGRWLGLEIPLGTVWSEEMAFRGALATSASAAFGSAGGRLVQASAFGMSHIPDALARREPLMGTVLVTGLAGWVFALLTERSRSLLAPMLAHLAINESGAVAALLLQRKAARRLVGSADG